MIIHVFCVDIRYVRMSHIERCSYACDANSISPSPCSGANLFCIDALYTLLDSSFIRSYTRYTCSSFLHFRSSVFIGVRSRIDTY